MKSAKCFPRRYQNMNDITCKICGATFSKKDVEEATDGTGFWCPECDGFTPYEGIVRNVDLSVCLERKEKSIEKIDKVLHTLPERISPLRYPGGKGKMLKQLAPYFPEHVGTIVEPFAGGASASLAMLFTGRTDNIVLNDLDPGVYAFWKCCLGETDDFLNLLHGVHGTREEFLSAKNALDHPEMHSMLYLAISFLVANQLAFSGITKAGIAGDYEKRWNFKKVRDRILKISEYKDRITVLQKDALDVIEEFYWDKNNFLFIDPPYVQQGKKLYREWYKTEDHRKLSELIRELTSSYPGCAKIVVTYDACPEIEEDYDFPYVKKIYMNRHYSCGCSKK